MASRISLTEVPLYPFWEKSETALDSALMLYLLHEAPPQDQTMEMMLTMLEYGAAKEGEDFFTQALIDSEKYFHPDDVENFHEDFTKENIMRDIREHGSFRIHYRLMLDGVPTRATLVIAPFREGEKERLVAGIKACKNKDKQ